MHVEDDVGLPVGFLLAVGVLGQVGGRRCATSTRRSRPARFAGTAVAAAAGTVDRRFASMHGLRVQRRRRWPATCHRCRLRSSTYPVRGARGYTRASTTCGGPVSHPACDTVRPGDTIAAARHYRDLDRPSRATTSHRAHAAPTNRTNDQPERLTTDFLRPSSALLLSDLCWSRSRVRCPRLITVTESRNCSRESANDWMRQDSSFSPLRFLRIFLYEDDDPDARCSFHVTHATESRDA